MVSFVNNGLLADADEQQFKSWMALVGLVEAVDPIYHITGINSVFIKLLFSTTKITNNLFLHSITKVTACRSSTRDCRYSLKIRDGLKNTTKETTLSPVRTSSCLLLNFSFLMVSLISCCSGAEPVLRHDFCPVQKAFPLVWTTGKVTYTVQYREIVGIITIWSFLFFSSFGLFHCCCHCRTALPPKAVTSTQTALAQIPSTGEKRAITWHL